MKTRKLGSSDLDITLIGFGAWAIGGGDWQFGWGSQEDSDSIAAIHRALELGINWIDTAAVYGLGHSEEVVAKALAQWSGPRPYVFTKCGMVWNKARQVAYSLKSRSIRQECENSLRRLGSDVIDLYQIHWPADDGRRMERTGQTAAGGEDPLDWCFQLQPGRIAACSSDCADYFFATALFAHPPRDRN